MLGLVTIFLATFLIAAMAVWLYRLLFGWSYKRIAVVGRQRRSMMQLSAQQGYISLIPKSLKKSAQQPVRRVVLNKSRGGLKAPWGW